MNLPVFLATETPTGPVTWGQLTLIFIGIALLQGLIKFGDRLWLERKEKKSNDSNPATSPSLPQQSIVCGMQHSQINDALKQQAEAFKETTKMLQTLAHVIREQAHAEEVRSQGISLRLDLLQQGQNELRREPRS